MKKLVDSALCIPMKRPLCMQTRPQEAAFVLSLLHPDPASRPTVDSIVQSQLLLALHKSIRSQRTTAGTPQGYYDCCKDIENAHCP